LKGSCYVAPLEARAGSDWSLPPFALSERRSQFVGTYVENPVAITIVRQTGVFRRLRQPLRRLPSLSQLNSCFRRHSKRWGYYSHCPTNPRAREAYQPTLAAYLWCLYVQGEPVNMFIREKDPGCTAQNRSVIQGIPFLTNTGCP